MGSWIGLAARFLFGCQGPCNHARLLSCIGTDSLHSAATLSLCARTPYRVVERRTGRSLESGFRSQGRPWLLLCCLRRWMRTLRSKGRENRGCLSPELPVGSFFRLLPSLRPLTRDYIVDFGTAAPIGAACTMCPREGTKVVRIVLTFWLKTFADHQTLLVRRVSLRERYGVSAPLAGRATCITPA